ncbi:MAG: hypothetical protein IMW96_06230 [Thermoanaerobacteraceae bacterium]|nr:hypothetical protein [Thermoanaerobacteraceae bacterium]
MPGSLFQMMTVVSLAAPIAMLGGWCLFLFIVWRFMRAHEAMAASYRSLEGIMQELAQSMKARD